MNALPFSLRVPAVGAPARVVVLRGLPASGKSTLAMRAVAEGDPGAVVRINNDEMSQAMFGVAFLSDAPHVPVLLAQMRESLLRAALARPQVRLVVVDNTNLALGTVHALHGVAAECGAEFVVEDAALEVAVEECLRRDAAREAAGERHVGEAVIRRMARQAQSVKPYSTPDRITSLAVKVDPYDNDPALPSTVIVDVDGTLALMGDRKPFDWHKVGQDAPNRAVVDLVRELIASGQHVTIMSGRDGVCRAQTAAWLEEHVGVDLPLFMRAAGDSRPDFVVKLELFDAHIAGKRSVRFVLDDRDQVVRLWRDLGLPTFQVAYGDF